MNTSNLLYYLLSLIVKGHEWQYQNATCTNKPPKFYFTGLQWGALLLAVLFVLTNHAGLCAEIIDFLLSSLSIMTGLFLALVVIVYEKSKEFDFSAESDEEKINKIKSWNYLRQFNALTSYAIFISLIVISILIGSLLYGHRTDFSNIHIIKSIGDIDIWLTLRVFIVGIVRFCMAYFLMDFFILTIYATSSLFQFINIEMQSKKPPYKLNESHVLSDEETLKKMYPKLSIIAKIIIALAAIGFGIYKYEFVKQAIVQIFDGGI